MNKSLVLPPPQEYLDIKVSKRQLKGPLLGGWSKVNAKGKI